MAIQRAERERHLASYLDAGDRESAANELLNVVSDDDLEVQLSIDLELRRLGLALRGFTQRAVDETTMLIAGQQQGPGAGGVEAEPSAPTADSPDGPPQTTADAEDLVAGRYRILSRLGRTRQATVHLAHDTHLGVDVALKRVEVDDDSREALQREAAALAQLDHPGVVRVYDVNLGPRPFLTMAFLPGPNLERVLDRLRGAPVTVGPLGNGDASLEVLVERLSSQRARLECAAEIAEALAYCHDRGVLHRDLKPANVVFDAQGRPCLVDLGLAHNTASQFEQRMGLTGGLHGTPAYLAPEQLGQKRTGADPSSDLYSLATLTYELATLERPFERPTVGEMLTAIEKDEVPSVLRASPTAPITLDRVLRAALAKRPEDRHTTVHDLASDLRAVLDGRPVSIGAPGAVESARRLWREHRRKLPWFAAAAGALFVTLAMLVRRAEASALERRVDVVAWEPSLESMRESASELNSLQVATTSIANPWLGDGAVQSVLDSIRSRARELRTDVNAIYLPSEKKGMSLDRKARWLQLFLDLEDILSDEGVSELTRQGPLPWLGSLVSDHRVEMVSPAPFRDRRPELPSWSSNAFEYVAVDPYDAAVPAYYRLRKFESDAVDAPLLGEIEFPHRGTGKSRDGIGFRTVSDGEFEWTAFEGGERTQWFNLRSDPPDLRRLYFGVPSFQVTETVTAGRYKRYCEESGREVPADVGRAPNDDLEAFVSWDQANDFAAWYGCRLPSSEELEIVGERGREDLFPSTIWANGEWVCNLPAAPGAIDMAQYFLWSKFKKDGVESTSGGRLGALRSDFIKWADVACMAGESVDAAQIPEPRVAYRGLAGQTFRLALTRATRAELESSTFRRFE
ncbi:bifunctional serine/threonine-protein kinase/formylglycine-generating enzyme family protein [Engelhardtia mirabilis]|uniref:Serine/threonine-protein kinase StkP n=1 Tax=Engelhardtia mirabilis TaxID=2528011 RepID=A0A518BDA2_9BACT|nr:Serine/threonine-protein kinase StkP [Planctomycetes bacterium Pla133]QDU99282.1 Serine/threonine-protein kinase StkP [Planctomycetes bacterium Pla86]